jgi:hypothetical protein
VKIVHGGDASGEEDENPIIFEVNIGKSVLMFLGIS